LFLVACGASAKTTAKPSMSVPTTNVIERPLAVRTNGILDPSSIDLSGLSGVTPAEEANAESLLRRTILALPRWSNVAQARKDGFAPIGDGFSGLEHYVHWDWIEDNDIFDPTRPESLLYRVGPNGKHTLEAAMFILPKRYSLDNAPDIGGKLVQFHIHDKLCFTDGPAPKFARPTRLDGSCTPPLVKLLTETMTHVWIRPNPCGPFAELGGLAAGAVRLGETHACDRVHGNPLG
jgi:hypothetical protein